MRTKGFPAFQVIYSGCCTVAAQVQNDTEMHRPF
jgi:hypothetical protein